MKFHDFFAGIGGSSTGLRAAGMEGVVALNHWSYAIDIHNSNHPDMDHDLADIWKADPRRYRHAEVGWFSPECRSFSQARRHRLAQVFNRLESVGFIVWGGTEDTPNKQYTAYLKEGTFNDDSIPAMVAQAGYALIHHGSNEGGTYIIVEVHP